MENYIILDETIEDEVEVLEVVPGLNASTKDTRNATVDRMDENSAEHSFNTKTKEESDRKYKSTEQNSGAVHESDKFSSHGGEVFLDWKIDDTAEDGESLVILKKNSRKSKLESKVPSYGTAFTGYLTEKEYSIVTGQHVRNDCIQKKICFNCLGDHNISDCKKKKNFQDITRNRKSILGSRPSNVRYHEVKENLYSNYKPGQFSEHLRHALNLRPYESPEFVYRMRVLGYPPGWLKEAEVKRSEVSLFDGSGKPLIHPEEEEGETDVSLVKYSPEKLLSFPGFNTPFPDGIKDQHRDWNMPPMQPQHSMESFLHFMTRNKARKYKRKKLKASATPRSGQTVKPSEMDVDDSFSEVDTILEFNPPLPDEAPKPPEPPPIPEQTQKKRVLEEGELSEHSNDSLENSVPQNSSLHTPVGKAVSPVTDSSLKNVIIRDIPLPTLKRKNQADSDSSCDSPAGSTKGDSAIGSTKRLHNSSSKGYSFGTCIPESITPYKSLPHADKWSVDVSDHLLFVNLPDALGTWNKMKGIVKNVQETLMELHSSSSEDED